MKYSLYIYLLLVVLVIVLLVYVVFFNQGYVGLFNRGEGESSKTEQQYQWEIIVDEQPPVTVSVAPIELGENVETWKFNISLETHSVSLDQDLMQEVTLLDDKGNIYQPILWEGPEPGGHHRAGVLVFNPINPRPTYLELNIKNIGGIPERSFKWNLE